MEVEIPMCERDFEQVFSEWLLENTAHMRRVEERLENLEKIIGYVSSIHSKMEAVYATFEKMRPLLERYEQATKAQGFRAQRAALKGKG